MASAAEQLASNFNFGSISRAKELRSRIFFTLGALIVARIGTYIPLPGIDPAALALQIQQQGSGLLDVFNTLAGGAVGYAVMASPSVASSAPAVVALLLLGFVRCLFCDLLQHAQSIHLNVW